MLGTIINIFDFDDTQSFLNIPKPHNINTSHKLNVSFFLKLTRPSNQSFILFHLLFIVHQNILNIKARKFDPIQHSFSLKYY